MNYYDMLGVKENATPGAIKAAYKTLVKRLNSNVTNNEKASALEMIIYPLIFMILSIILFGAT